MVEADKLYLRDSLTMADNAQLDNEHATHATFPSLVNSTGTVTGQQTKLLPSS